MAHKYPPWQRAILVPFWTVQLALMLGLVAILTLAVGVLTYNSNNVTYDDSDQDAIDKARKIYIPISISLAAFCAILIIAEIVLLTRRKLTPLKFVIFNSIKSAIWGAVLVYDIIVWARSSIKTYGVRSILLEVCLNLSFWIPLFYGVMTLRRSRRHAAKSYQPISHPLTNHPGAGGIPHDTAYPSQLQNGGHPPACIYGQQVTGVTGGAGGVNTNTNVPAYDPYKPPRQNYGGDLGMGHQQQYHQSPGLSQSPVQSPIQGHGHSYGVPQVHVQHHQDVYEMDSRR